MEWAIDMTSMTIADRSYGLETWDDIIRHYDVTFAMIVSPASMMAFALIDES